MFIIEEFTHCTRFDFKQGEVLVSDVLALMVPFSSFAKEGAAG